MILVTGAAGQVGTALVSHLRSAGRDVLPSDFGKFRLPDFAQCDLRSEREVARLFERYRFSTIVHLAAVLPTAFRSDPLTGAEVNLSGTLRLLRAAVDSGVRRFVFGSSASVYGNTDRKVCTETEDPAPDDAYGASKLAVEKILEQISTGRSMETVSLRIARVLGPGARNTGSPWRSQMFEQPPSNANLLAISFAPQSILSVIHVEDLSRALRILVEAPATPCRVYNAPAELMRADEIKQFAEGKGWKVSLGMSHGGPQIDGTRFAKDFEFAIRPLKDYVSIPAT